ncbi:hypothetical protein BV898_15409 [Hypsibius exemplaris]|uniref:Uncharacterized protein n=1 Tax=Hypsibius exemplaris TaxID=2072580 RepID=A0A9X6NCX4_HYPEX|nr:hypothetical protein BV898_15409 [Hypsibius exemplaris]
MTFAERPNSMDLEWHVFSPFWTGVLSVFGLYSPSTTVNSKRSSSCTAKAKVILQQLYWTCCCIFLSINATSSAYIVYTAITEPYSVYPILNAVIEVSLAIETHRGTIFCLLCMPRGKDRLRKMLQQSGQLISTFGLADKNILKIGRFLHGLFWTIMLLLTAGYLLVYFTWCWRDSTMNYVPFFYMRTELSVILFILLNSIPEYLSRMVVILIVGLGLIMWQCLKVVNDGTGHGGDLRLTLSRYYILVRFLDEVKEIFGGLLAFSLFADIVPVCGRTTRLLFTINDFQALNPTVSIVSNFALVILGVVVYIFIVYSPFILLHTETLALQRKINSKRHQIYINMTQNENCEEVNKLNTFIGVLKREPIVLEMVYGFQVRENFPFLILTVLASYVLILYQTTKDTALKLQDVPTNLSTAFS